MAKPKENTITKIDELHLRLSKLSLASDREKLISALVGRCHTMNINKAKLAYFKDIKVVLTRCLAAVESGEMADDVKWQALQKDLLTLLHTKNG